MPKEALAIALVVRSLVEAPGTTSGRLARFGVAGQRKRRAGRRARTVARTSESQGNDPSRSASQVGRFVTEDLFHEGVGSSSWQRVTSSETTSWHTVRLSCHRGPVCAAKSLSAEAGVPGGEEGKAPERAG